MLRSLRNRIVPALVIGTLALTLGPQVGLSQPRKARYATQAELERVEKKLDEQKVMMTRLIKLQQQYLQSLLALSGDPGAAPAVAVALVDPGIKTEPEPKPVEPKPIIKPAVVIKKVDPAKPLFGTVVGKVKGGGGEAVVYIDDPGVASRGGTATMKQQGKQFVPRVLVVQKGTRVEFPNTDTVFHNVFSVTPDNSFDLGSYRQGESKSVTLAKAGVVTVYCNMHPQMVGHVLIVPNALFAKAGADGFYKIANVPAGKHRIVAWAPNAKPVVSEVEVVDSEAATVELEVSRRGQATHTNKDGLPYGSYKD